MSIQYLHTIPFFFILVYSCYKKYQNFQVTLILQLLPTYNIPWVTLMITFPSKQTGKKHFAFRMWRRPKDEELLPDEIKLWNISSTQIYIISLLIYKLGWIHIHIHTKQNLILCNKPAKIGAGWEIRTPPISNITALMSGWFPSVAYHLLICPFEVRTGV